MPLLRNAFSRKRSDSLSKLNDVSVKICESGLNVTFVPRLRVLPVCFSGATGIPRAYSCSHVLPSRQISRCRLSERKLTHETPTPCRPPETLYAFESNLPPA